MKCTNCGYELQDDSLFCTNCGAQLAPAAPYAPENNKVLAMLKDSLFLVSCILVTVAAGLKLIGGEGIPVIETLFTIFLWLTYSQAAKGIADEKHLRCVSGTVYADYIITNVAAIIVIVCGVIVSAALGLLGGNLEFMSQFTFELEKEFPGQEDLVRTIFGAFGWLIGLIFVIAGVIILVINILGKKKIHRFVKSVYQSLSNPYMEIANPRAARGWLIFLGVCSGVSAISNTSINLASVLPAIADGCLAATTIIAAVLVGKYFLSNNER